MGHASRSGTPLAGMRDAGPAVLSLAMAVSLLPGCSARNNLVMEMSGTVMYEKPAIQTVTHRLDDARESGGPVSLEIVLLGDPGLEATFDISPGVADHSSMTEKSAGRYSARFDFPEGTVGGPFTVLGRLKHPDAGEVVLRDPEPITIPLLDSGG